MSPTPFQPSEIPTIDDLAAVVLSADATAWERRMKALMMRVTGAPYAQIATSMIASPAQLPRGYDAEYAARDVKWAVKEVIRIPVDQMIDRQRAVLLELQRVNMTRATDPIAPDTDAGNFILKCMEHEAKLFGLYAPSRVNVGISESEFGAQAAQLLTSPAALAALQALARQQQSQLGAVPLPQVTLSRPVAAEILHAAEVIDAETVDIAGDIEIEVQTDGEPPVMPTDSGAGLPGPVSSMDVDDGWSNL
jgi:hypothetical protein